MYIIPLKYYMCRRHRGEHGLDIISSSGYIYLSTCLLIWFTYSSLIIFLDAASRTASLFKKNYQYNFRKPTDELDRIIYVDKDRARRRFIDDKEEPRSPVRTELIHVNKRVPYRRLRSSLTSVVFSHHLWNVDERGKINLSEYILYLRIVSNPILYSLYRRISGKKKQHFNKRPGGKKMKKR